MIDHYGGVVAGPVFRRVGEAALRHLGVPASGRRRGARRDRARARARARRASATARRAERDGRAASREPGAPSGGSTPREPGDGETRVPESRAARRARARWSRSAEAGLVRADRGHRHRRRAGSRGRHDLPARDPRARRARAARWHEARSPRPRTPIPPSAAPRRRRRPAPRRGSTADARMPRGRDDHARGPRATARRRAARRSIDRASPECAHDSRAIERAAISSSRSRAGTRDGRAFVAGRDRARRRGGRSTEAWIDGLDVPQLLVARSRGLRSRSRRSVVYGDPTSRLRCDRRHRHQRQDDHDPWLIDEALLGARRAPALLGTVETRGPGIDETSAFTTPEADAIARFARAHVDAARRTS